MTLPTPPDGQRPKKDQKRRARWAKDGYGLNPQCYLCQQNPATTDDHVPPKGLFATTGGSDAYLVPACSTCNGALTRDENYLRNVLASSGLNREASKAVDATLKSLLGSSPLYPRNNRADLFKNVRERDIYSAGGILIGREPSFDIDNARIDPVIEKIVKGLYYHDLKKPLPADLSFRVAMAVPQDPKAYGAVEVLFDDLSQSSRIAEGEFPNVLDYWAWPLAEDNSSSLWLLEFYRSIVFLVPVEGPRLLKARATYQDGLIIQPPSTDSDGADSLAR